MYKVWKNKAFWFGFVHQAEPEILWGWETDAALKTNYIEA